MYQPLIDGIDIVMIITVNQSVAEHTGQPAIETQAIYWVALGKVFDKLIVKDHDA